MESKPLNFLKKVMSLPGTSEQKKLPETHLADCRCWPPLQIRWNRLAQGLPQALLGTDRHETRKPSDSSEHATRALLLGSCRDWRRKRWESPRRCPTGSTCNPHGKCMPTKGLRSFGAHPLDHTRRSQLQIRWKRKGLGLPQAILGTDWHETHKPGHTLEYGTRV
jgi:hypothetical protein